MANDGKIIIPKTQQLGQTIKEPSYMIRCIVSLERMPDGWDEDEMALPTEERETMLTIPRSQLANLQIWINSVGNQVGACLNSMVSEEAKRQPRILPNGGGQ